MRAPKRKKRNYCKYCYSTHSEWYDDGDHDYGVLVCGRCQHATLLFGPLVVKMIKARNEVKIK